METDLNNMCDEKLKKYKYETETKNDIEIEELTKSCKDQCNERLHKVNTSAQIECKKGKDQL